MAQDCAICNGTGFELREEGGVLTSLRCSCESEQRGARLEAAARIPQRYAHCSFDGDPGGFKLHHPESQQRTLDICREWVEAR